MNTHRTGRNLQLEGLENLQTKVTLGFKCDPMLKLTLAKEANSYSMSLSEYVELLTTKRNENNVVNDQSNGKELKRLRRKVAFYEHDLLKAALAMHQGKTLDYETTDGEKKEVTINRIEDVFQIVIDTIKLD
jgi:hypothetical protein